MSKNVVPYSRAQIRRFTADYKRAAAVRSAAPEMYAALMEAKSQLIELYERCYPDDESENEVTKVIDRVIAAIALAKGGE